MQCTWKQPRSAAVLTNASSSAVKTTSNVWNGAALSDVDFHESCKQLVWNLLIRATSAAVCFSLVPRFCSDSRDAKYRAKPLQLETKWSVPVERRGVLVEKINLGFSRDRDDGSPLISTLKHGLVVLSAVEVWQRKPSFGSFFWPGVNADAQKFSRLPRNRTKEGLIGFVLLGPSLKSYQLM